LQAQEREARLRATQPRADAEEPVPVADAEEPEPVPVADAEEPEPVPVDAVDEAEPEPPVQEPVTTDDTEVESNG
ncbi:MAG: hypothetical protein ACRDY5_05410, partial [Acidimicrobiales bacterium]